MAQLTRFMRHFRSQNAETEEFDNLWTIDFGNLAVLITLVVAFYTLAYLAI